MLTFGQIPPLKTEDDKVNANTKDESEKSF